MKTAEEWANEIRHGHNVGGIDETVKQIQLDAMKEGARRAAELKVEVSPIREKETHAGYGIRTHQTRTEAILTTAEQWTEQDL